MVDVHITVHFHSVVHTIPHVRRDTHPTPKTHHNHPHHPNHNQMAEDHHNGDSHDGHSHDHDHEHPAIHLQYQEEDEADAPDLRIPVTILTGFLGAGKTTMLNHLLQDSSHGYKFAIIENELGDVGIDDRLLQSNTKVESMEEEIIEVVNGCICCTVRGDLLQALQRLHTQWLTTQEGKGQAAFDAVLIETTGLADPGPVVQTFFIEDSIKERFVVDSVLTVVDSQQILTRLDEEKPEGVTNEALQQILFADKIFLNKVDQVSPEELQAVQDRIRQVHPTAPLIPCEHGQVPAKELVHLESFQLERICEVVPDFLEDEFLEFGEKHDSAISSVACSLQGEMNLDLLQKWITRLVEEMGANLYRYKGLLAIKGMESKFVFQGVGMLFQGNFSEHMEWAEGEPKVSQFVFIGKNLDAPGLRAGFDQCRVLEELRFGLGDIVWANVGTGWAQGKIVAHWDEGNAYRIELLGTADEDGAPDEVWAPLDHDLMVRLRTPEE